MRPKRELSLTNRESVILFASTPNLSIMISCIFCKGNGCNICKHAGWLEILGCGMVDPEVFKAVDYDSDIWQGYAFGLGIP